MDTLSTKDLIKQEIQKLINETKKSIDDTKRFAMAEVWKILQLLTATVVQLIENVGNDLSSPEKKQLALDLIGSFYDSVFKYIDIPWVPSVVEPVLHTHIKSFLMIFVSAGIDATVTTFRQIGVFKPKEPISIQTNTSTERKVIIDFLNNIQSIVRNK